MSAIDPNAPADSEDRSLGDDRIREHRQWLYDFATAFLARHQGSGYDPSTWTGEFKVPFTASGNPTVGDIYFQSSGQAFHYKAGPVLQLAGDIEGGSKTILRQNTAPTGWTRDTGLTGGAVLRYTTGTVGSGGIALVGAAIAHAATGFSLGSGAIDFTNHLKTPLGAQDHPALKYLDTILVTRD